MSVAQLAKRLGVSFNSLEGLTIALTHRSARGPNNERLEFVGDAVLGLAVAEQIFDAFPEVDEGALSRIRASLVNKHTLADVANELQLGEHIQLGEGELKSGGHRRESILADAFEAILAAVYLDQGYDQAKQLVYRLFLPRVQAIIDPEQLKDPKTRLQEYLQAKQMALPNYALLEESGEAHAKLFKVQCEASELNLQTQGEGSSRRYAEQAAAESMLTQIESS